MSPGPQYLDAPRCHLCPDRPLLCTDDGGREWYCFYCTATVTVLDPL